MRAAGLKAVFASVCLLAVLLPACAGLPGTVSSELEADLPETVSAEPEYATGFYFGRAQLDELDGDRDHLVNAYDRVVRAMKEKKPTVEFSIRNPLAVTELKQVFEAVFSDRSDLYWVDNAFKYNYQNDQVVSAELTVLAELTDKDAAFEEGVQRLLDEADLSPEMRPVDKELALHDALCRHVTYKEDAPHAFSAYGAVVDGEAVCSGYSKAFQVLLRKAGIPSFVLQGSAENRDGSVEHAWNLIRLGEDGYCYTDVTWGDPSDPEEEDEIPFYTYFNRSLTVFNEDHSPAMSFALPEGSEDWNYYRQFPDSGIEGHLHASDSKLNTSIVSQIRKNGTARVYFADADPAAIKKDLDEWIVLWSPAFANALGWKNGYTFGYSWFGREVHLIIGPPNKKTG